MQIPEDAFRASIRRQIEINRARTSEERFEAFCQLMEAAWATVPTDAEAVERRRRVRARREREREALREFCRRHAAAERAGDTPGI